MKFGPVSVDEAEGKILGHNVAGPDGRRSLRKGRPITAGDVALLKELGRSVVYAAELETGDVGEDGAAERVGRAAAGPGLRLAGPAAGRVNFLATALGLFRLDPERLCRLNDCEGVALATVLTHLPVRPGQMVATLKIVPFGVGAAPLARAERVASDGGPLLRLQELARRTVGFIFTGSAAAKTRVMEAFEPLGERVLSLGSRLGATRFVTLDESGGEARLADTATELARAGCELVVIAGETAIMDRHDVVPRAVERAGGQVECVGAPVDPGHLLMLGYLGSIPILGAPGCARSRKTNIVDFLLPRLLAGELLARRDIVAMGHGGLLEDVAERPMRRDDLP